MKSLKLLAVVVQEFAGCLAALKLDYVDLVLMHYPGQPPEDFAEYTNDPGGPLTAEEGQLKRAAAWRAMQSIKAV